MSATNGAPTTETGPATPSTFSTMQPGQSPAASQLRNIRVVLVAALVLAIVGVGFGVYQLTKPVVTKSEVATLRQEVHGLQVSLTGDHSTITTLNGDVANLKSSSTAGQVAKLKNSVNQFQVCVPQLQSEINGLNIDTDSQDGALTDAYLQNPTIISSNCSRVLNGSETGG